MARMQAYLTQNHAPGCWYFPKMGPGCRAVDSTALTTQASPAARRQRNHGSMSLDTN